MKIAVEGCCHGQLDNTYAEIAKHEREGSYKVDLLLICGDFQAVRNRGDLRFMAVPDKYKKLGGFHRYYTGEAKAPVLTIVIGGNHEASNYMWELYHGGWLAPNIYYLGSAGSVLVNGLRLAGISGIYKPDHYTMGHHERFPYNSSHMRSIYHTRIYDVQRLMLLESPDIFISHDWPLSIEQHGDTQGLLRHKPFFKEEIRTNTLGSPPLLQLLNTIRPQRWFAAHLHTRFEAVYKHDAPTKTVAMPAVAEPGTNPDEIILDEDMDEGDRKIDAEIKGEASARTMSENPDEIALDDEEDAGNQEADGVFGVKSTETCPAPLPPPTRESTQFLALDKCLPKRRYLEIVDVDTPIPIGPHGPLMTFNPQWLAIMRAAFPYLSLEAHQQAMPDLNTMKTEVEREGKWIKTHLTRGGTIPVTDVQEFKKTAVGGTAQPRGIHWYTNPQTEALCRLLELENVINPPPATLTTSSIPTETDAPKADVSVDAV
ncbi:Metallophos-domain-containing protein [Dacryopinax primogenitus]|uniref:Metallophos-domain-containing protein n=1 Tax=Dacryopinax primogenitus (strain DJM 731) TaxID=1858805 RepID=M5G6N7_DACPD|nr:Metallophos-domain-containing protein [Dacryopinax primogenitus]EJU05916.1 Metallophos-domain-containing protein [Dacryopinax primogenitus]